MLDDLGYEREPQPIMHACELYHPWSEINIEICSIIEEKRYHLYSYHRNYFKIRLLQQTTCTWSMWFFPPLISSQQIDVCKLKLLSRKYNTQCPQTLRCCLTMASKICTNMIDNIKVLWWIKLYPLDNGVSFLHASFVMSIFPLVEDI